MGDFYIILITIGITKTLRCRSCNVITDAYIISSDETFKSIIVLVRKYNVTVGSVFTQLLVK